MSDSAIKVSTTEWVERAPSNDTALAQREITQIILHAVSSVPQLAHNLYLKGGILMGLVYKSSRQTTDIDFSTSPTYQPTHQTASELREQLNSVLNQVASDLGYTNTVLNVQTIREHPRNRYPNAEFPALQMKIAYAERNSHQERQLKVNQASSTVGIDITFKEKTSQVQILELDSGATLLAYSLTDVVAEKFRALLQQGKRNRYRRQDVYDLDILTGMPEIDTDSIYKCLIQKCENRDICPTRNSMDDPEIKRRAGSKWNSLETEIGKLPDFEECYGRVSDFYRRLPWPDI